MGRGGGYVGTRGAELERIDDVNRVAGDLLDGVEDRINPHFGVLLFATNGVSSRYDALTLELRRTHASWASVRPDSCTSCRLMDTMMPYQSGRQCPPVTADPFP